MNHIVFCINEKFTMPAGILISSIQHYNKESAFTYHIFSKNITNQSKEKLCNLLNSNSKINFYNVNDEILSNLPIRQNDHISIEAYYRFLIPSILSEDIKKVLYLDCDILCTGNLDELFKTNIDSYSVGMVRDSRNDDISSFARLQYPPEYGYYCSGVILYNLTYWRENNLSEKCIQFISENPYLCLWHDQDTINKVLHESIFPLDFKYDLLPNFFSVLNYLDNKYTKINEHKLLLDRKYWTSVKNSIMQPVLIHFGGKIKPWFDTKNTPPFTSLWREFYKNSPWKSQKLFKNYKKELILFIKSVLHKGIKYETYPDELNELEQKIILDLRENLSSKN